MLALVLGTSVGLVCCGRRRASQFTSQSRKSPRRQNPRETHFTVKCSESRGVCWDKRNRRWRAQYTDANDKMRFIGNFDDQEAAAHAVNAAIRRAGLEGRRKTNPVVDGQLVPRALKAPGHGESPRARKRRRDKSGAAIPSTRAHRPRRAVDYAAMVDPDFQA